jgi:uncharacterized membrane protein YfcA
MPDLPTLGVLLGGALVGSFIGGIAGFGTGVIMLPLVAWALGVRAVGPVLTVTMLFGNFSRAWWSRRDVDRGVALRFLAGALPGTVVGAGLYVGVSSVWLGRIIGLFLLLAVPLRRLLASGRFMTRLSHFPVIGVVFGLVSSLVVTTGPVMTPFFLSYGLRRAAYIGTESVCAFAMHIARGAAFARYSLLTREAVAIGVLLGTTMFAGSYVARRVLDRMSDRVFLILIEALLVLMGVQFLLLSR